MVKVFLVLGAVVLVAGIALAELGRQVPSAVLLAFAAGAAFGASTGASYARGRRSWADWRTAKRGIRRLRGDAFRGGRSAITSVVLLALVAVAILMITRKG